MTPERMLEFQKSTISLMKNDQAYYENLYNLTKHSKKKAKHLFSVNIMEGCIESSYEEYRWTEEQIKKYGEEIAETIKNDAEFGKVLSFKKT